MYQNNSSGFTSDISSLLFLGQEIQMTVLLPLFLFFFPLVYLYRCHFPVKLLFLCSFCCTSIPLHKINKQNMDDWPIGCSFYSVFNIQLLKAVTMLFEEVFAISPIKVCLQVLLRTTVYAKNTLCEAFWGSRGATKKRLLLNCLKSWLKLKATSLKM